MADDLLAALAASLDTTRHTAKLNARQAARVDALARAATPYCPGSGATAAYDTDYSNRTGRACQVCGKSVRPITSDPSVLDKTPAHR